jgi:hypothetical protein
MKSQLVEAIQLTSGGGTVTIDIDSFVDTYRVYTSGAVTLTSNYTIEGSKTPSYATVIKLRYEANLNFDGNTVTIFGATMPEDLENINCEITAYYNGTSWIVTILPDFETIPFVTASFIETDAVTTAKIQNDAVTLDKLANITRGSIIKGGTSDAPTLLDAKTSGRILVGDGTDLNSVAVSGDLTLAANGAATIANNAVTTAKINDGAVTLGKLEANIKKEILVIPVSFESGEQCEYSFFPTFDGVITSVSSVVTKAIAGTDDADIDIYVNSGSTTPATLTLAASSALNTLDSVTITNGGSFTDGDQVKFTTSKATAGGKALLTIAYTRD